LALVVLVDTDQVGLKVLLQVGTAQHWAVVQQFLRLAVVTALTAPMLVVMVALVVAGALAQDQAQQAKETTAALLPTMCHPVVVVAQEQ
jgi:hypothetical protein